LLLGPYARAVAGTVSPDPSLQDDDPDDSAPHMPWSVVCGTEFDWDDDRPPGTPLEDSILYELHVKGFTNLHPDVPEKPRATNRGVVEPAVLDHLKRIGVTAIELLPVLDTADGDSHSSIDPAAGIVLAPRSLVFPERAAEQ
jgi:glycogen operon protein